MNKIHAVIGLGEIGQALYDILSKSRNTYGYDLKDSISIKNRKNIYALHIAIPYSVNFVEQVIKYTNIYDPEIVVIHSTVPVGTTAFISDTMLETSVFHSPVRGKHPDLCEGILTYVNYISYEEEDFPAALELQIELEDLGMKVKTIENTKNTELGKLLSLARYGVYLSFAKEQEDMCKTYGLSYKTVVTEFEESRNEGLRNIGEEDLQQPLLTPFNNFVGGHCVTENMAMLSTQISINTGRSSALLDTALRIGRGTIIWANCNVYPTAIIGKGCSIGTGSEIGNKVVIGNNTRVGAMCFIPEGVIIEENCFIAPKVTFSNDKYPPSSKVSWGEIRVKRNAVIGMGSIVLPGVTIGENAVVGAGSIVTKDVEDNGVVYGQAASPHGNKEDVYNG